MQHLEHLAARVRIRRPNSGEESGEPDFLIAWIVIGGIILAIVVIFVLVSMHMKKQALKRIETYFGAEGRAFVSALDPKTRKAFIQIVSAIQSADDKIKERSSDVDHLIHGYLTPYAPLIRGNESLGWYRFLPYELDALIAYAKGDQEVAKLHLAKAKELRGDGELISEGARLIDA